MAGDSIVLVVVFVDSLELLLLLAAAGAFIFLCTTGLEGGEM